MPDEIAIKVDNVSKTFREQMGARSVKQGFVSLGRKIIRKTDKALAKGDFTALKDISFEVKKGEFFGIVGRNGSGKSTLLKIIAGVYSPTKGAVTINGKLTPFIELGVGFNPELSGRDNVFLNGALLGFSRKQMEAMYSEIVEFAELNDFMDVKLKNYSSGMQVRLAFSIAIRAESEILLIDEVLAVGDAAFQKKCYEYFVRLKKAGRTVCFVTHDMGAVEKFCDRVFVIDKSVAKGVFIPAEASNIYQFINTEGAVGGDGAGGGQPNHWGTGKVSISDFKINNKPILDDGVISVKQSESMRISSRIVSNIGKQNIVFGLSFVDQYGVNVAGPNSIGKKLNTDNLIEYIVPKISLVPGEYRLVAAVFDEEAITEYDHYEEIAKINIISGPREQHGKVNLFGEWKGKQ